MWLLCVLHIARYVSCFCHHPLFLSHVCCALFPSLSPLLFINYHHAPLLSLFYHSASTRPWQVPPLDTPLCLSLPPLPPGSRFDSHYQLVLLIDQREQYTRTAVAGAGGGQKGGGGRTLGRAGAWMCGGCVGCVACFDFLQEAYLWC